MKKFFDFIGGLPNGIISKLLLLVCLMSVLILIVIGVTQLLKDKGKITFLKTEYLSVIVSEFLIVILYVLYCTVFKYVFIWYELLGILFLGVLNGVISSLVAEKVFKLKKK